ncbi:MAG TPA: HAD-IIB family hydrolase [Candidatus Microsaccharimonas sp.]|jgi:HAD superfamily hydrolase (TIGR01484 family)
MKKVFAFDMDDTIAITKSPISERMATAFNHILDSFDICIISGGNYELFEKQLISRLDVDPSKLKRIHLMPTCGTRYYRYDEATRDWALQYAEDLTDEEKAKTAQVLEEAAKETGYWPENPAGEVIEDRLSQITFSGLGQLATPEAKYAWDPDTKKRRAIRDLALDKIPELEIRIGGTTSIDVTRKGIDKAYGMQKLMEANGFEKSDILFFGDKLQEGGNDYPVKAFGIESIEVTRWEDTANCLEAIVSAIK